MPRDEVEVAPNIVKVLFENERVRVLEVKLKKHQKMAMHSHPANLVYALTRAYMKSTSPEGKSQKFKMKKGQIAWSEGGSHTIENLGDTVVSSIAIELKK